MTLRNPLPNFDFAILSGGLPNIGVISHPPERQQQHCNRPKQNPTVQKQTRQHYHTRALHIISNTQETLNTVTPFFVLVSSYTSRRLKNASTQESEKKNHTTHLKIATTQFSVTIINTSTPSPKNTHRDSDNPSHGNNIWQVPDARWRRPLPISTHRRRWWRRHRADHRVSDNLSVNVS